MREGKWIEDSKTYPGPGLGNYLCSECGELGGTWKYEWFEDYGGLHYCPWCGSLNNEREAFEVRRSLERDRAIFADIDGEWNFWDKLDAIKNVIDKPDIGGVKKENMEDVLRWLVHRFDVWHEMSKRPPLFDGEYIVQLDDGYIATAYYNGEEWELWADAGEVVAWMNLPICRGRDHVDYDR